jgi:hypothetical protein
VNNSGFHHELLFFTAIGLRGIMRPCGPERGAGESGLIVHHSQQQRTTTTCLLFRPRTVILMKRTGTRVCLFVCVCVFLD